MSNGNYNATEVIVERSRTHVLLNVEQRNSFSFSVILDPVLAWETIKELTTQVVLLEQELRNKAAENPTVHVLEGTQEITPETLVPEEDEEEEGDNSGEEVVEVDTALAA